MTNFSLDQGGCFTEVGFIAFVTGTMNYNTILFSPALLADVLALSTGHSAPNVQNRQTYDSHLYYLMLPFLTICYKHVSILTVSPIFSIFFLSSWRKDYFLSAISKPQTLIIHI